MGKVLSVASRKARRFNVESRAHRLLDKEKPDPAPKFKSNILDYNKVLEEQPNFAELQSKKNIELDDRLKRVYVTSTDTVVDVPSDKQTQKPLPLNKKQVVDYEYGYLEPEKVAPGRVTLRQAMTFISNHSSEPETWTTQRISDEYKLKPNIVDSVLKHFYTFELYVPEIKKKEKVLLRQRVVELFDDKPKPLPPPTYEPDAELERLIKEHENSEKKKAKAKDTKSTKQIK
ncbi:Protein NDUFAF4 like [Pseudolycoriella hygida]|uniref:Protein NDUFAF4 like n=1 Tax=Pseudolycoriella hygida TaxID=35572 RepID=A0A9Q0MUA0_9DIPT|nr:Protein NDUFAF4 like [Pseudolycoriella hygida]